MLISETSKPSLESFKTLHAIRGKSCSYINMGSEPIASQCNLTPCSEPESEQQAASAVVNSHTSRWIPRSCYGCNTKKIRCDKKKPCSSCTRAGKPCGYPPVGQRKRRAKETIMADMASRIKSLEKSITKVRENEASVSTILISEAANTSPLRTATALHSGNLSERSREDVVVQKGSSSQYFNEIILSRVIREVFIPMSMIQFLVLIASIGAKHRICLDNSSNRVPAPSSILSVQCLGDSLFSLPINTTC